MALPRVRGLVVALLLGPVLALAVAAVRGLALPPGLQALGHAFYRLVFMPALPAVIALSVIRPPTAHHLAEAVWIGGVAVTPLLVWLTHRALLWRRAWRASKAPRGDGARPAVDLGRRRVLQGLGVGAAGCAATYPSVLVPEDLTVRTEELTIDGLPAALDGLRLVHLSDTHHGPFIDLPYLERVVATANGLSPDVAVLTGDYVHDSKAAIGPGIGVFAGLRARFGTVAVLGNHDHWEDADLCRARFREIGVPLLENRRRFLTRDGWSDALPDGAAPEALCIAGVGDLWAGRVELDRALGGVPPEVPRLLLAHNPDTAELIPKRLRVDLMIAGHTHGGQVRVPFLGTPAIPSGYGQKYAGGLCRGPRCLVQVSRGVGMTILPVRLGVPPELTLLVLRAPRRG